MQIYKYEKIIEKFRKNIQTKKWQEGARIPSERDLAIDYGVSRITIKKAIECLIEENLLIRYKSRKGTFVYSKKAIDPINLVGVAIDDVSDRFGSTLLRGIEDFLWHKKIHTVICNGDRDFYKVREYFNSLSKNNIDGVIFSPVIDESTEFSQNIEIVKLLETQNIPFVLIDRTIPGYTANSVSSNHYESARMITRELISRGHTNILLMKGLDCSSMNERENGYLAAFQEAKIAIQPSLLTQFNDNKLFKKPKKEEVRKIYETLKGLDQSFSAVVVLNNRLLNGFILAMEELNPNWDDDITVGLYDAFSLQAPKPKKLLQIVQPDYEIGKEAARLLLQVIEDASSTTKQIVIESKRIFSM